MSSDEADPKTPYNEMSDEQLQNLEKEELQEMIQNGQDNSNHLNDV